MKDLVKRAKSFMTFDYPLQIAYISTQFANTHNKFQAETPGWSTVATRQKLISDYWFNYVAAHFAIMFGLPAFVFYLWHGFSQTHFFIVVGLTAGLICFPILYLFHYKPYFSSIFLPRLETVKESYERKEIKLLEKCRQAQLPNFTLTLIFYVFDKTSGINALQCNEQFAGLLRGLYGVDKGSLKKNLELIIGKRKKLATRQMTEIQNRFTDAYQFFEELKFLNGIHILKDLELNLTRRHDVINNIKN